MQKSRFGLIVVCMLMISVIAAEAQVSIGISTPNVSIGVNLPLYPELAPVPGYPVYYAPQLNANYFFYDGMYWVYQDDNWYASAWYNGPWGYVRPEVVPVYILRIPVRYYRQPPVYFRGWQPNAPPRWGQHWGHGWEQQRRGWDKWNRKAVPARAPLPAYQRQYSGDRYPEKYEQQRALHSEHYRYQPRNSEVRRHYNQKADQRTTAPAPHGAYQGAPGAARSQPAYQPPHQQRGPAPQEQRQQPVAEPRQQSPQRSDREYRPHERVAPQEPGRGHGQGQGQGQGRDDERGRGHN